MKVGMPAIHDDGGRRSCLWITFSLTFNRPQEPTAQKKRRSVDEGEVAGEARIGGTGRAGAGAGAGAGAVGDAGSSGHGGVPMERGLQTQIAARAVVEVRRRPLSVFGFLFLLVVRSGMPPPTLSRQCRFALCRPRVQSQCLCHSLHLALPSPPSIHHLPSPVSSRTRAPSPRIALSRC